MVYGCERVVYCCNGDYIALIAVVAIAAAVSRGGLPGIERDYTIDQRSTEAHYGE